MVSYHALRIQILHAQDLVLVREHGSDLVQGIGPGIGDLRMDPGNPLPLLQVPVARLLVPAGALSAGKPALLPRELALVFLEMARIPDFSSVRERGCTRNGSNRAYARSDRVATHSGRFGI